jgi:UDP-N-acetyl-D-glucosamine dehydrogenase
MTQITLKEKVNQKSGAVKITAPASINVKQLLSAKDELEFHLDNRTAKVGVVGLGYVGLPLLMSIARANFQVIGFDIDDFKIEQINSGKSYIDAVRSDDLSQFVINGKLSATIDTKKFNDCDVICICVPTPLTRQREPDLSFIVSTTRAIASHLRAGQIIILESTSYPGTTDDVVKPILEETGLRSGTDYFIGYSPERENPGSTRFNTTTIPKIVAGDGEIAQRLIAKFYGAVVATIVPVSSVRTAEVVKITENVFRAVNIGLMNELKLIYDEMGIDVWEVIEAAKTKPFGFMAFYPGPGLGGHCIPVDPFYLTWKSREFEMPTRFIELAGEINQNMPRYVVRRLEQALDRRLGISLSKAAVLVVGLAYKKNVSDLRESPALKILALLKGQVADLAFHDPLIAKLKVTRNHPELAEMKSIDLSPTAITAYTAIIVVTDHDSIDYQLLSTHSQLIIDTRNAFASRGFQIDSVVKA